MFPYWSAPPSLLRTWACPDEPDPAYDDKLHFGSLLVLAGEALGSLVSQAGCYLAGLLPSRAGGTRRLSGC